MHILSDKVDVALFTACGVEIAPAPQNDCFGVGTPIGKY